MWGGYNQTEPQKTRLLTFAYSSGCGQQTRSIGAHTHILFSFPSLAFVSLGLGAYISRTFFGYPFVFDEFDTVSRAVGTLIPLIFAAQLGNVGVSFAEPRLSHMTALLQMSLVTGECRLADLTVAVSGHWRSNLHLFALGRLEVSTELTCLESPLLKFLLLELTIHLIVLLKSSHRYLVSGQHESWGEVLSIC